MLYFFEISLIKISCYIESVIITDIVQLLIKKLFLAAENKKKMKK